MIWAIAMGIGGKKWYLKETLIGFGWEKEYFKVVVESLNLSD